MRGSTCQRPGNTFRKGDSSPTPQNAGDQEQPNVMAGFMCPARMMPPLPFRETPAVSTDRQTAGLETRTIQRLGAAPSGQLKFSKSRCRFAPGPFVI